MNNEKIQFGEVLEVATRVTFDEISENIEFLSATK